MFNIGDEVRCTSSRTGSLTGKVGVVVNVFGGTLYVKFEGSLHPIEMFSWRFQPVDGLSSICGKIRQMDERWKKFQEMKRMAL